MLIGGACRDASWHTFILISKTIVGCAQVITHHSQCWGAGSKAPSTVSCLPLP
jgi:hypothetical protein